MILARHPGDTLHVGGPQLRRSRHASLGDVSGAIDDTRPTVIIACTVKARGLASEGHPQNHSSLLSADQIAGPGRRRGMSLHEPR
ncbi:hypothetical protein GCM10023215_29520 [Pseudonocardia yuanmonensis]|uniref:Uncharacterized protein n=1 Tax=Pseudonocardia yuanmonensis TaxID=1095914 RepID=A0ABP8WJH4_9PSEU